METEEYEEGFKPIQIPTDDTAEATQSDVGCSYEEIEEASKIFSKTEDSNDSLVEGVNLSEIKNISISDNDTPEINKFVIKVSDTNIEENNLTTNNALFSSNQNEVEELTSPEVASNVENPLEDNCNKTVLTLNKIPSLTNEGEKGSDLPVLKDCDENNKQEIYSRKSQGDVFKDTDFGNTDPTTSQPLKETPHHSEGSTKCSIPISDSEIFKSIEDTHNKELIREIIDTAKRENDEELHSKSDLNIKEEQISNVQEESSNKKLQEDINSCEETILITPKSEEMVSIEESSLVDSNTQDKLDVKIMEETTLETLVVDSSSNANVEENSNSCLITEESIQETSERDTPSSKIVEKESNSYVMTEESIEATLEVNNLYNKNVEEDLVSNVITEEIIASAFEEVSSSQDRVDIEENILEASVCEDKGNTLSNKIVQEDPISFNVISEASNPQNEADITVLEETKIEASTIEDTKYLKIDILSNKNLEEESIIGASNSEETIFKNKNSEESGITRVIEETIIEAATSEEIPNMKAAEEAILETSNSTERTDINNTEEAIFENQHFEGSTKINATEESIFENRHSEGSTKINITEESIFETSNSDANIKVAEEVINEVANTEERSDLKIAEESIIDASNSEEEANIKTEEEVILSSSSHEAGMKVIEEAPLYEDEKNQEVSSNKNSEEEPNLYKTITERPIAEVSTSQKISNLEHLEEETVFKEKSNAITNVQLEVDEIITKEPILEEDTEKQVVSSEALKEERGLSQEIAEESITEGKDNFKEDLKSSEKTAKESTLEAAVCENEENLEIGAGTNEKLTANESVLEISECDLQEEPATKENFELSNVSKSYEVTTQGSILEVPLCENQDYFEGNKAINESPSNLIIEEIVDVKNDETIDLTCENEILSEKTESTIQIKNSDLVENEDDLLNETIDDSELVENEHNLLNQTIDDAEAIEESAIIEEQVIQDGTSNEKSALESMEVLESPSIKERVEILEQFNKTNDLIQSDKPTENVMIEIPEEIIELPAPTEISDDDQVEMVDKLEETDFHYLKKAVDDEKEGIILDHPEEERTSPQGDQTMKVINFEEESASTKEFIPEIQEDVLSEEANLDLMKKKSTAKDEKLEDSNLEQDEELVRGKSEAISSGYMEKESSDEGEDRKIINLAAKEDPIALVDAKEEKDSSSSGNMETELHNSECTEMEVNATDVTIVNLDCVEEKCSASEENVNLSQEEYVTSTKNHSQENIIISQEESTAFTSKDIINIDDSEEENDVEDKISEVINIESSEEEFSSCSKKESSSEEIQQQQDIKSNEEQEIFASSENDLVEKEKYSTIIDQKKRELENFEISGEIETPHVSIEADKKIKSQKFEHSEIEQHVIEITENTEEGRDVNVIIDMETPKSSKDIDESEETEVKDSDLKQSLNQSNEETEEVVYDKLNEDNDKASMPVDALAIEEIKTNTEDIEILTQTEVTPESDKFRDNKEVIEEETKTDSHEDKKDTIAEETEKDFVAEHEDATDDEISNKPAISESIPVDNILQQSEETVSNEGEDFEKAEIFAVDEISKQIGEPMRESENENGNIKEAGISLIEETLEDSNKCLESPETIIEIPLEVDEEELVQEETSIIEDNKKEEISTELPQENETLDISIGTKINDDSLKVEESNNINQIAFSIETKTIIEGTKEDSNESEILIIEDCNEPSNKDILAEKDEFIREQTVMVESKLDNDLQMINENKDAEVPEMSVIKEIIENKSVSEEAGTVIINSEEPETSVIIDDEEPTTSVILDSGEPKTSVIIDSEEPGASVIVDSEESETFVIIDSEEPRISVMIDSVKPENSVIIDSEEPEASVIIIDSEEPENSVVIDSGEPGYSVITDSDKPGTSIVIDSEEPGTSVFINSGEPGDSIITVSDKPGTSIIIDSGEPGTSVVKEIVRKDSELFDESVIPGKHIQAIVEIVDKKCSEEQAFISKEVSQTVNEDVACEEQTQLLEEMIETEEQCIEATTSDIVPLSEDVIVEEEIIIGISEESKHSIENDTNLASSSIIEESKLEIQDDLDKGNDDLDEGSNNDLLEVEDVNKNNDRNLEDQEALITQGAASNDFCDKSVVIEEEIVEIDDSQQEEKIDEAFIEKNKERDSVISSNADSSEILIITLPDDVDEATKAGLVEGLKEETIETEVVDASQTGLEDLNEDIIRSKVVNSTQLDTSVVPEMHQEDSKIPEELEEESKLAEKIQKECDLSEKHQEDEELPEKLQEDEELSEKLQEDEEPPRKLQEDEELPEKLQEDHELSEKLQEESELPEKFQSTDCQLAEKLQEGDKVSEKIHEDSKIPEKLQVKSKLLEKPQVECNLSEKLQEGEGLPEKLQEDEELSEKLQEDKGHPEKLREDEECPEKRQDHKLSEKQEESELPEKLQEDHNLAEKLQEESALPEKLREDHKLSERLQEESKLPEKLQEDHDLREKLQEESALPEKHQEDHKLPEKLQKESEPSGKLQSSDISIKTDLNEDVPNLQEEETRQQVDENVEGNTSVDIETTKVEALEKIIISEKLEDIQSDKLVITSEVISNKQAGIGDEFASSHEDNTEIIDISQCENIEESTSTEGQQTEISLGEGLKHDSKTTTIVQKIDDKESLSKKTAIAKQTGAIESLGDEKDVNIEIKATSTENENNEASSKDAIIVKNKQLELVDSLKDDKTVGNEEGNVNIKMELIQETKLNEISSKDVAIVKKEFECFKDEKCVINKGDVTSTKEDAANGILSEDNLVNKKKQIIQLASSKDNEDVTVIEDDDDVLVQGESSKEIISESTKETSSEIETNKGTLSEVSKGTLIEANKETLSEMKKGTVGETNKEILSEVKKETISEAKKGLLSETNKEILSEVKKGTISEAQKVTISEVKEGTVSEATKETLSESSETGGALKVIKEKPKLVNLEDPGEDVQQVAVDECTVSDNTVPKNKQNLQKSDNEGDLTIHTKDVEKVKDEVLETGNCKKELKEGTVVTKVATKDTLNETKDGSETKKTSSLSNLEVSETPSKIIVNVEELQSKSDEKQIPIIAEEKLNRKRHLVVEPEVKQKNIEEARNSAEKCSVSITVSKTQVDNKDKIVATTEEDSKTQANYFKKRKLNDFTSTDLCEKLKSQEKPDVIKTVKSSSEISKLNVASPRRTSESEAFLSDPYPQSKRSRFKSRRRYIEDDDSTSSDFFEDVRPKRKKRMRIKKTNTKNKSDKTYVAISNDLNKLKIAMLSEDDDSKKRFSEDSTSTQSSLKDSPASTINKLKLKITRNVNEIYKIEEKLKKNNLALAKTAGTSEYNVTKEEDYGKGYIKPSRFKSLSLKRSILKTNFGEEKDSSDSDDDELSLAALKVMSSRFNKKVKDDETVSTQTSETPKTLTPSSQKLYSSVDTEESASEIESVSSKKSLGDSVSFIPLQSKYIKHPISESNLDLESLKDKRKRVSFGRVLDLENENKDKDSVENQMEIMFIGQGEVSVCKKVICGDEEKGKQIKAESVKNRRNSKLNDDTDDSAKKKQMKSLKSRIIKRCADEGEASTKSTPNQIKHSTKLSDDIKADIEIINNAKLISDLTKGDKTDKETTKSRKEEKVTKQEVPTETFPESTNLPHCSNTLGQQELETNRRPIRIRKKKFECLDEETMSIPIKKRYVKPKFYTDIKPKEDTPKKQSPARKGRGRKGASVEPQPSASNMSNILTSTMDENEEDKLIMKEAADVSKKRWSSDSDDESLISLVASKKQRKSTLSECSSDDKVNLQQQPLRIKTEQLQQSPQQPSPQQQPAEVAATPTTKTNFGINYGFPSPTERIRRKCATKVAFTMLHSPELESLVRTLGGRVVDSVDDCTVLVTNNVFRTQKLLMAVGQCKPVCSPEWLRECKKDNTFLDPWNFLLIDKDAEAKWNFSIEESYKRSRSKKLFLGYSFYVMSTLAEEVLKGAIESCGGKIVSKMSKNTNFVVVASEENRPKCIKYFKQNVKVVLPEAIFDGVLRQEIVFDNHLLT